MFENEKYSKRGFNPLKALGLFGVFVVFAVGMSWLVMFLWNAILPDTVGVKPLNFWKAAGLLLLAKILFGGFKGRGRSGRGSAKREHWKKKWMGMSSEERDEAKARWKAHCERKKNGRS
ncbi:MAG: hypothetical protein AB8F95_05755 [Bacteroidia bacterium]